jgi:hypothetical protein
MTARQKYFERAIQYWNKGPEGDEHEIGAMSDNGIDAYSMLCIKPDDTEEFYEALRLISEL